MPPKSPSLLSRALLAIALMIGFYALAAGLAAGLLFLPLAGWRGVGLVHPGPAVGCILTALAVVKAAFPRRLRDQAAGVPLREADQPELFAVIREVATAAGHPMPDEICLIASVDAFVTQRGGWMGFGSQRVLAIGICLLQTAGVDELRGVLAHEFGHFTGGDTRLLPWIHETRAALGRSIEELEQQKSALRYPFRWYARLFRRLTLAVSRAQELAADRLAAGVVGTEAVVAGLLSLTGASKLFPVYFEQVVAPVISARRRPPLAKGLAQFMASAPMRPVALQIEERALATNEVDRDDSHPPLPERIAAALELGAPPRFPRVDRPAIELLSDRDSLEAHVLAWAFGRPKISSFRPIEWSEAGEEVIVPRWREEFARWNARPQRPFTGITLGQLPDRVESAWRIGKACASRYVDPQGYLGLGLFGLAVAAGLSLHRAGFKAASLPGAPVVFERAGHRFAIEVDVSLLFSRRLAADEWRARCSEAGVLDLPLDPAS